MENILANYSWFISLISLWALAWKGFALWRASHLEKRVWFIVLLFVNTIGILELIYLIKTEKIERRMILIWPLIISIILAGFFVFVVYKNFLNS